MISYWSILFKFFCVAKREHWATVYEWTYETCLIINPLSCKSQQVNNFVTFTWCVNERLSLHNKKSHTRGKECRIETRMKDSWLPGKRGICWKPSDELVGLYVVLYSVFAAFRNVRFWTIIRVSSESGSILNTNDTGWRPETRTGEVRRLLLPIQGAAEGRRVAFHFFAWESAALSQSHRMFAGVSVVIEVVVVKIEVLLFFHSR